MGYRPQEVSPSQNTIDSLLDYVEAHAPLSEESELVVREAWDQHDAYPCRSGEAIRRDIVETALSRLVELNAVPVMPKARLPYILLRANATKGIDAEELVRQTNSHLHAAGIIAFLESNREFNAVAVGKAVAAVLKGIDPAQQDKLLDVHNRWLANRTEAVIDECVVTELPVRESSSDTLQYSA